MAEASNLSSEPSASSKSSKQPSQTSSDNASKKAIAPDSPERSRSNSPTSGLHHVNRTANPLKKIQETNLYVANSRFREMNEKEKETLENTLNKRVQQYYQREKKSIQKEAQDAAVNKIDAIFLAWAGELPASGGIFGDKERLIPYLSLRFGKLTEYDSHPHRIIEGGAERTIPVDDKQTKEWEATVKEGANQARLAQNYRRLARRAEHEEIEFKKNREGFTKRMQEEARKVERARPHVPGQNWRGPRAGPSHTGPGEAGPSGVAELEGSAAHERHERYELEGAAHERHEPEGDESEPTFELPGDQGTAEDRAALRGTLLNLAYVSSDESGSSSEDRSSAHSSDSDETKLRKVHEKEQKMLKGAYLAH